MAERQKLFTTKGLVLKTRALGERDRIITLLTPGYGKLICSAPGARKTKSSLAALVEPFSCGKYLLHRGKSFYTISQAEKVKVFSGLREDLISYTYACHFSELIDSVMETDGGHGKELFHLLHNSLLQLNKAVKPSLVGLVFELKLLDISGYRPHLANCVICGEESSRYHISWEDGGVICSGCSENNSLPLTLSGGSLAVARFILGADWPGTSRVKITETQQKELAFLTKTFLQSWVGVTNYKAMSFLEKLNNS